MENTKQTTETPGPSRLAKKLKGCELKKENAQLKSQIQRVKYHATCLEGKLEEVATELNGVKIQRASLQSRVSHLDQSLQHERGSKIFLKKKLEESKEQLAYQKRLKKVFIKKEKEVRKELKRLKNLSDKETDDYMEIPTESEYNLRRKPKNILQIDFEELQVGYKMLKAELEAEREKSNALQQELAQLKVSYETNLSYETELRAEREMRQALQRQLENVGPQNQPEQPRTERDAQNEEEVQIQTRSRRQGGQAGKKPQ